jgi:hypothetical protein
MWLIAITIPDPKGKCNTFDEGILQNDNNVLRKVIINGNAQRR